MSNISNAGKTLLDQGARDVIAQDLDSNVMVLAGAGAGKTTALVDRMVAVVREGKCEIDHMAAITFTRKAAGEMRGRFFLALREEAEKNLPDEKKERLQRARDRIDQCFMGTIHSFCGRLIRTRPIEAGLAPGFREIEGYEEAELLRATWGRFLQERYNAGDDRMEALRERGIAPQDLYKFFVDRCAYPDLPLKQTEAEKPDLAAYVNEVREFMARVLHARSPRGDTGEINVDGMLARIPFSPESLDDLMHAVRHAQRLMNNLDSMEDGDIVRLLTLFESNPGVTLDRWTNREEARRIRDETLPAFQEITVAPALRRWREYLYRGVTDFVTEAVEYCDAGRHKEGKLTFQDLLLRAARLLRENPSVRQYFQARYRTLFVDEFQDTDPIQAEIIAYLTGTDIRERDWRKLVPRPGSLLLVGDDKQSIYRFRRADVAVFHFVKERIKATGGNVVHLNTSFRSLGNLCRWINNAFPPIFSPQNEGVSYRAASALSGEPDEDETPGQPGGQSSPYQAEFAPLDPYLGDGPDAWCVRRIAVPKQKGNNRSLITEYDARRIASFIARAMRGQTALNRSEGSVESLLAPQASAGDFLILTRLKSQIPVYTRALEALGISYDVTGGGLLGESKEVRAVVTLLEAVYAPENPVPFVAYLRGPLVGLSDGALYEYRRAEGCFDWRSSTPDGLSGELRGRFGEAKAMLVQAEKDLTVLPAAAALERILGRCGYLAFAAVHPDGEGASRAGNLIRMVSWVQRLAAQGLPWGRIVEELSKLVNDSAYEVEQMSLESGREDVVRVMNVHQAKGLEAKVVFLADPYQRSGSKQRRPSNHVSRVGRATYLSLPVMKPRGPWHHDVVAQPAGWKEDQEEAMRFQLAEEARLLYVAATRARDLLVVSVYDEKADTGPWAPLNPYLANVPELEGGGHWEDNMAWARETVNISDLEADGSNGQDDAGEHSVANISEPEGSISDASHRTLSSRSGYEELCMQAAERLRRAQEASYSLRSVTRARTEEEWVSKSPVPAGRGMKYGQLVHRLFEEAVRDGLPGDPSLRVAQLADQINLDRDDAGGDTGALLSGADPMGEDVETFAVQRSEVSKEVRSQADLTAEDVKAAVRAVERLKKSPLWETLQRAHEVYTEAPLAATEGDAEHATVTRGVIDLAYRDEAGWHIVDYKTDRADTEEASAAIEKKYRSQLDAYATYWSRLTGTPVADAKLWLAHGPTG